MDEHKIYIIAAVDKNFGIGKDNKLPWHFSSDLKFFAKKTTITQDPAKQNMVIMGRKTWESIPEKFRPLKDRLNVVLTSNHSYQAEGGVVENSIEKALEDAGEKIENIFIIGGATLFKKYIDSSMVSGLYLTHIDQEYDCEVFFPKIPPRFSKIKTLKKESEKNANLLFKFYSI